MPGDTTEYPDWWVERYCIECHRRKESCECGLSFAEKARSINMDVWKLRRQRKLVGPPGHQRSG